MGERAELLAKGLEEATDDLIETAKGLTDQEWETQCEEDGRTAGEIVNHMFDVYTVAEEFLRSVTEGTPYQPIDYQTIDERNAAKAEASRAFSRQELTSKVVAQSSLVLGLVRSLDDSMFEQTFEFFIGSQFDLDTAAQVLLTGHTATHLASIKEALGR